MFPEDEFRLKVFKRLRQDGKYHPIKDFVISQQELEMIKLMRSMRWINIRNKTMQITIEGRRVCKCLERIYQR